MWTSVSPWVRGERVRIHPHSVNAKLHDNIRNNASNSDLSAAEKKAPVLVCFDEAGGPFRTLRSFPGYLKWRSMRLEFEILSK
jgi:hypothetical protein